VTSPRIAEVTRGLTQALPRVSVLVEREELKPYECDGL